MANGLLDPPPAMQGALATDQRLPPGVDRPKGFWRMMGDWARRQPPPQFGGPTIDLKDRGAVDWMGRQRENLDRIQRYGEQHQMIWPGAVWSAGTGLLELIQGTHTGVMTPEAVMGLLDVGTLGTKPAGALGALAFHGSKHKFGPDVPGTKPGLDPSKVGTGEGVQQYGRGAGYLAEDRELAKSYQPRDYELEEVLMRRYQDAEIDQDYEAMEVYERAMMHDDPSEIRRWLDDPETELGDNARAALDQYAKDFKGQKGSHLYEFNVDDAAIEKMLDWDKPLSEQPQTVRDAIKRMNMTPAIARRLVSEGPPEYRDVQLWGADPAYSPTGSDLYNDLVSVYGSEEAASRALAEAGIPGIKYLDEASRGEGARNFVVFDPETATLKARDDVRFNAPTRLDEKISARHGVEIDLSEGPEGIVISKIVAPEPGTRSGTRAMQDIIDEADRRGVPVALTPSTAFGGNKKRLEAFYKGLGFVPNKGRNKNFMFKEAMIRPPREFYARGNTNPDSPLEGADYAMFASGKGNYSALERIDHYGAEKWTVSPEGAVDANDLLDDIAEAFQRRGLDVEYGVSARELAESVNPSDIVDSAGIWDDQNLVSVIWDDVLEPRGIAKVKTDDGLILFDPSQAKRLRDGGGQ